MLFKTLTFAASAAAFLVVPETVEGVDDVFQALPIDPVTYEIPASALTQSVELPCAQCDGDNARLRMDFTVEKGTELVLNGFQLDEPNETNGPKALVMADNAESVSQPIEFSISFEFEGLDELMMMEASTATYTVLSVGGRAVDVPSVELSMITAANGEILIGNVEILDMATKEPCESLWCRTKEFFSELGKGLSTLKHCHGPSGEAAGNTPSLAEDVVLEGDRLPNTHEHHQDDGEVLGKPSFGKVVEGVIAYILLPIVMGVAAGVGVAMIGVLMCQGFARLATLACSRRRASTGADQDEEKSGLMADVEGQELPPSYEEDVKN